MLAGALVLFIALRIVHGFAFGMVSVAGNTIVIDILPSSRRGEGLGYYGLKWGTIMAACCVIVFPLLLLFLIGQRWILNGITNDAAVKE